MIRGAVGSARERSPVHDSIHVADEHRMLREQVRRFVEREVLPHAGDWEAAGKIPREVFRKLGDLGVLGMRCPVEHGGSGLDALASVVLAEELGRSTYSGFAVAVLVHTDMASPHLIRSGREDQLARYVPGIVSGDIVTAVAVTEPDAGSDVQGIRTRARREGNGWVLNGSKVYITNGVHANLLFVAARTDPEAKPSRGTSMFIVERETPGFRVARQLDKMGWLCSDTAELVFEDARLPADALLGEENRGFYEIMKNFQNERLVAAAANVGEAAKAIELTLQYTRDRKAFGGTLWDHQAIRQRLAALSARVEGLRHLVYHTAWLDTQGVDCVAQVSMAKAWGGELVNDVVLACQRFHGAFGFMRESAIERMARDTRAHLVGGGATEVMYEEVAKRMEVAV